MPTTDTDILVVESVEGACELHEHWLSDAGHAVDWTTTPPRVRDASSTHPDVVLIDKRILEGLPSNHGDAAFQSPASPSKIVAVIDLIQSPDVVALRFDDYVHDPVSRPALVDAIDRVLARPSDDDLVDQYVSAVNKLALAKTHTTPPERAASQPYRDLEATIVDLARSMHEEERALTDDELTVLSADTEAEPIAHDPLDALELQSSS